jgi:hypothetical protein
MQADMQQISQTFRQLKPSFYITVVSHEFSQGNLASRLQNIHGKARQARANTGLNMFCYT